MDIDLEVFLNQDPHSVIIPTLCANPSLAQKTLEDGSTLLHLACKNQSPLEVIKTLLNVSTDAARITNKGLFLPLHSACASSNADVKIVSLLLSSYYNGIKDRNAFNNLPIHTACANLAPLEVITVLVDAYPESLLEHGMNDHLPIFTALSRRGTFDPNSSTEHQQWIINVASIILQKCPKSATITDSNNDLALHWACRNNVPIEVHSLLINANPEAVHIKGHFGYLPLHKACEKRANISVVKFLYEKFPDAVRIKDSNNALPLHLACSKKTSIEVILFLISTYPGALLVYSSMGLPHYRIDGWDFSYDLAFLRCIFQSIQAGDNEAKNVWVHELINNGEVLHPALDALLDENPSFLELAYSTTDHLGRKTLDAAPPSIKKTFQRRLFLCGVYEIMPGEPEHKSATSIVYFANDHSQQGSPPTRVAIKFMEKKEQFEREKDTRQHLEKHLASSGIVSPSGTLPILASFDGETDIDIATQLKVRGFGLNPYVLVLPAANRSLRIIVESESGGKTDESLTQLLTPLRSSWTDEVIRAVKQIAIALSELHSAGFVHGDVKPRNIVRGVDSHFKLIDMDAAARIGEPAGLKLSTAFAAPEIACALPNHIFFPPNPPASPSCPTGAGFYVSGVPASVSLDAWSLGVTLYHMLARQSLFHADDFDNLASPTEHLDVLRKWPDDYKTARLSFIKNRAARHLLSLLLYRDPLKRPSMKKVLSHAFLTGRQPKRLPNEPAKYDVFISYRKASDALHVKALAESLVKSGLRVWWDNDLTPGQNWMKNFCEALASSRIFVPLVSRDAVNATDPSGQPITRQNWSYHSLCSDCDNVLLEWRMACELREQGLMEGAVPVYFGVSENGVYGDFFTTQGCRPSCPDVEVQAVEESLCTQMSELGLGEPLTSGKTATVKYTWEKITVHQGVVTHGTLEEVISQASEKILASVNPESNESILKRIASLEEEVSERVKMIDELRRSSSSSSTT